MSLVEQHVKFARWVAWKYRRRCPDSWGPDIESAAFEGLVLAARAYNPDRAVTFTAYAYPRVRGTILDEVRLLATGHRYRRTETATVRPFADFDGDQIDERSDPAVIVEADLGTRQQAHGLLDLLGPNDRQLVRWYYYDGLTFAAIGARIGITEAGVFLRLKTIRQRLQRISLSIAA
jgi:RNA polymerase sigma factor (sigma-70 family)